MKKLVCNMRKSQAGATMVEYGLMLALIAVVCVLVVAAVGNKTAETFNTTQQHLNSGTPLTPTT